MVVALGGGLGVGDLGGVGVEFGVPVGVGVVELCEGFGDDFVQDGVGVGVEVVEGLEDGGVGGVGGESDAVAAGGAVAVVGKAGVVAVAGVAALDGGVDILASAVARPRVSCWPASLLLGRAEGRRETRRKTSPRPGC